MKKIFTITIFLFLLNNSSFAQVTPFLPTTWNQTCFYNDSCPVTSGGYCGKDVTGCVATASAQILRYYSYPTTGMGSHCNFNSSSNCVDFSKQTYNYSAMPAALTSSNSEVAKLMYDLGVAVDMDWGATASSAGDMSVPLKTYFGYSPVMYQRSVSSFSSFSAFIQQIKIELNAGRPVIFESSNHTYLVDGYNASNQFHLNFGWGGYEDGYYDISNVTNAAGNYNPVNAYFNVRPLHGELEMNASGGYDSLVADTIVQGAFGGVAGAIEFSSTTNWTAYTTEPWFDINLSLSNPDTSSGGPGYYSSNSVAINSANTGYTRYGYIIIKSDHEMDTIVVKQLGALTTSTLAYNTNELTISIYPNPANSNITMNVASQLLPGNVTISDMQGKILKSYYMEQSSINIGSDDLANGFYLIQFENGRKSSINKVAIVH